MAFKIFCWLFLLDFKGLLFMSLKKSNFYDYKVKFFKINLKIIAFFDN